MPAMMAVGGAAPGGGERLDLGRGGVDQHVEDDGRAAEMSDIVGDDLLEDGAGLDLAKTYMRAAQGRDGPGESPAGTVEHGESPKIGGVGRKADFQGGAERAEIGAAVVRDDALWISGGAGCVVDGDGVPFIGGERPWGGVVGVDPGFVFGGV